MKPRNYYNDVCLDACAWTKQLIKDGLIPDGEVDSRSICDVRPEDLKGFTQCHFFNGVSGWAMALRQAGWPDDRPIWTGSAPCQGLSTAGKKKGFEDERHLWPELYRLIKECRPTVCAGEQVASKLARSWLNLVLTDFETIDYCGAAISAAALRAGAPHKRERIYWVADTYSERREGRGVQLQPGESRIEDPPSARRAAPSQLADTISDGSGRDTGGVSGKKGEGQGERFKHRDSSDSSEPSGSASVMANRDGSGLEERQSVSGDDGQELPPARRTGSPSLVAHTDQLEQGEGRVQRSGELGRSAEDLGIREGQPMPGPTNGYWSDPDWLYCTDGKWRCTGANIPILVNGLRKRTPLIRGYGNAIVVPLASSFIKSYMELGRG